MSRYHKTIKGVEIDIYDILRAYEVKSHAVGHAVKKLLMAGQRGAKPYEQDLQEAVMSIERERDDYLDARNASVKHESGDDGYWIVNDGTAPKFNFVDLKTNDGRIVKNAKTHKAVWEHPLTDITHWRPSAETIKSSNEGWIEHKGDICPVPLVELVSFKLRNGTLDQGRVQDVNWVHDKSCPECDIIRYKVLK